MKRFLTLGLMAILLVGLALTPAMAAPSPTGTVVFWGMNPESIGSGNAEMIAALEEMYPGLVIDAQTTPGTEGYATQDVTKLLAAIAAGTPPDVSTLDRFTVSQFAARGALQPLDPFLESFGVDINEYEAYTVDEVTFDGQIWGVPTDSDTRMLFWNKDLFEDAGLDPEVPPNTWAELLEMAEKLTIIDDNDNIERIGFIPNYGNSWLYIYGFQNGATFLSEDGRTAMLDDPKLVEALEFMVSGYDLVPGGAAQINAFQGSFLGEGDSPFIQGQVAMIINGHWELENYARYAPDMNYGVCLAPTKTGEDKITWAGGWSWVIPAGAKNAEGGFATARFFTQEGRLAQIPAVIEYREETDPGSVYLPSMIAHEPTRAEVLSRYVNDMENKGLQEKFLTCIDAMSVAKHRPVTPVGEVLWNEHAKAAEKAFYHDMTPEEALKAGNVVVQEELDKFWADYDAK